MEQKVRYEVLILASPEITQDEGKDIETQFDKVVQASKGSVISFERWGKYKLAYPVRKNDYGVYFLTRFEIPAKDKGLMEQVKTLFAIRLENVVMRTVTTALDGKNPLEYNRPRSLEEAPVREEGYREARPERPFIPSAQEEVPSESEEDSAADTE